MYFNETEGNFKQIPVVILFWPDCTKNSLYNCKEPLEVFFKYTAIGVIFSLVFYMFFLETYF